jgi:hypothetical protein
MGSANASVEAKPPSNVPATVAFRCPGDCTAGDAIRGDGLGSYPASINANSELTLGGDGGSLGGRVFHLDFGPVTGCTDCRRDFITATSAGELQTNVINPATGSEASNGLKGIPVGATWPSFLYVNFQTVQNGATILWTVRFNPSSYPASTTVDVTRTSETSWVIEATAGHVAQLVSKQLRKRGETNEGTYVMPFRIAVTTN